MKTTPRYRTHKLALGQPAASARAIIAALATALSLGACALGPELGPELGTTSSELSIPIVGDMVETIGRTVHHLPLGAYAAAAGRTFIAYPGCSNSTGNLCQVNPHIVIYDHFYAGYSSSIDLGKDVGTSYPGDPDSHNYPAIVIDDNNYVHVFFSRHVNPIQHYVSKYPATSDKLLTRAGWEERTFSHVNQNKATYVMAFKDNQGDIYVFFRQSVSTQPQECVPGWYEPISYVKSSNNGATWTAPRYVLDPNGANGWNTVYVKGVRHEQKNGRDRLHIAFNVTRYHNCQADKLYYAYFDFTSDNVFAPTGANLGLTAVDAEWSNASNKMEVLSDPVNQSTGYFSQTAIGVDGTGRPTLFSSTGSNAHGKRSIDKRTFTGSSWSAPTRLFWYANNNTDPLEVDFQSGSDFKLYVRKDGLGNDTIKIDMHRYLSGSWSSPVTIDSLANANGLRFSNFAFVKYAPSNTPYLRATYILGEYTHWSTPQVGGQLFPD